MTYLHRPKSCERPRMTDDRRDDRLGVLRAAEIAEVVIDHGGTKGAMETPLRTKDPTPFMGDVNAASRGSGVPPKKKRDAGEASRKATEEKRSRRRPRLAAYPRTGMGPPADNLPGDAYIR